MPALPQYIIEPIWEQFRTLLPRRKADHPLGCHKPRIPDRVIFEKLLQILIFGCAYVRIADAIMLGHHVAKEARRVDRGWSDEGAGGGGLKAYDRLIGLKLTDMGVDGCITKAPCGGQKAGRSPVDRGKRGLKRSAAVDANGIPLGVVTAPANRHDSPLLDESWARP